MAVKLEAALFEKHGDAGPKYLTQFRKLTSAFTNNQELRAQILSGMLEPYALVRMQDSELVSAELRTRREEAEKKRIADLSSGVKGSMMKCKTDIFKCGKCKQKECSFYQKQTRSSDEPMTTFITCDLCGHEWRE